MCPEAQRRTNSSKATPSDPAQQLSLRDQHDHWDSAQLIRIYCSLQDGEKRYKKTLAGGLVTDVRKLIVILQKIVRDSAAVQKIDETGMCAGKPFLRSRQLFRKRMYAVRSIGMRYAARKIRDCSGEGGSGGIMLGGRFGKFPD
jgi:hypothetical protein